MLVYTRFFTIKNKTFHLTFQCTIYSIQKKKSTVIDQRIGLGICSEKMKLDGYILRNMPIGFTCCRKLEIFSYVSTRRTCNLNAGRAEIYFQAAVPLFLSCLK